MFKKNLTSLSIINVYVKLTSLVIVPFIARKFTIEEFGLLALAQSILGYVLDCFDGGIKKVGIRDLSKKDEIFSDIASKIFSVRIIMLVFAFIFMNLSGVILFKSFQERLIIFIISISIIIQIFDISWIYDAQQNMKIACLSKGIERTAFLIISILGIYLINIKILAFSFPCSTALSVSMVWLFVKNKKIYICSILKQIDYIREGLIIGFSGIASSMCLTIDQFMVKYYIGSYNLGLYCAATKLFFVILTFLWIYSYAIFPKLSKSSDNKEEIKMILSRHVNYLGILGTLTVVSMCVFSNILIKLFFSDKFITILPIFKILNLFLIIAFLNILFSDSLNAFNMQKIRLFIIIKALLLNILLNIFFIPRFGILGAVYSSIFAQLFILILSYEKVNKVYELKIASKLLGILIVNFLIVFVTFNK